MPNKVFIVGGNGEYRRMFTAMGWEVVDGPGYAHLVQFTGGEDVTPWLYGEPAHRTTHYNLGRDIREIEIFGWCLEAEVPMAGICRGGQFLNVMCGGKMWQDVDGHAMGGTHPILDMFTHAEFEATSTHHQMMKPGRGGLLVGIASPKRATYKHNGWPDVVGIGSDIEILHYPEQKVLCFQPHPEFAGHDELRDRYFGYLTKYLGV